ncbi:HAMP domain-containing protein [Streptomyces sp. NPDC002076]
MVGGLRASGHRVQQGFAAFGCVSDGRLRAQLGAVRTTKGSAELLLGWRNPAVAAVAPFNDKLGVASALGWKVASIRPAFWIGLPEYEAQRRIMLVGLLGVTTGALCLGWLYLVVVRPLREIAQRAEALAARDRRTVLYPRYRDEVGSVARSLELIQTATPPHRRTARARFPGRRAHPLHFPVRPRSQELTRRALPVLRPRDVLRRPARRRHRRTAPP